MIYMARRMETGPVKSDLVPDTGIPWQLVSLLTIIVLEIAEPSLACTPDPCVILIGGIPGS
jgi:hypothetical protein